MVYTNYLFWAILPVYKLNSLLPLEGRHAISQGPQEQLPCRGKHARSQGRDHVLNKTTTPLWSDRFPSLDTHISTLYSPCLHALPAMTTFPTHLLYIHTHKHINPFVSYHVNRIYAQMYIYIDLSVYKWRRTEEVQWWKPWVQQSPDCQTASQWWGKSKVKSPRQGQGWAQVPTASLRSEPELARPPSPAPGEASHTPFL